MYKLIKNSGVIQASIKAGLGFTITNLGIYELTQQFDLNPFHTYGVAFAGLSFFYFGRKLTQTLSPTLDNILLTSGDMAKLEVSSSGKVKSITPNVLKKLGVSSVEEIDNFENYYKYIEDRQILLEHLEKSNPAVGAVGQEIVFLNHNQTEEIHVKICYAGINSMLNSVVVVQDITKDSIDHLTGCYKKSKIEYEAKKRQKLEIPFYLCFIDLDNFKEVNDTYGHDTGDKLLIEVVNRINNSCENKSGTLGRYGGDEFILLLDGNIKNPKNTLDNIINNVSSEYLIENDFDNNFDTVKINTIGVSIGVSSPNTKISVTDLVMKADRAMYKAKGNGKGSYVISRN
jgi:diguanylate cyclase (GGDEF)-like protein